MSDNVGPTREQQIITAKDLYSQGSRNYLVKCYTEAVDDLSQVCSVYEEIYGELSDELGMPYLLYAKSLLALALEENKVIDVPDEEDDEEEEDDSNSETPELSATEPEKEVSSNEAKGNRAKSEETKEPDSTDEKKLVTDIEKEDNKKVNPTSEQLKINMETEEAVVTSTKEDVKDTGSLINSKISKVSIADDEKPSTSNGIVDNEEDENSEVASTLQLAWEILELAAKIFTRQGMSGLPNLAEVQTELANIEFENNILDSAREDYEKALKIYKELPDKYRRAMAEIHYKVGLTYLMQQMNQEGAESLKEACALIEDEITEMNAKVNRNDKENENIKDMEETKQEIWAKIAEIEETRQQHIAQVRAALDNFISPSKKKSTDETGTSSTASSSVVITSSSKPTDISHLIKRKKTDAQTSSEAEVAESPAKKPAV